jgi:sporulation protein YlmC with PRC-barrel domain
MVRAKDLRGRPIVNMEGAERFGRTDELILDLQAHRIAGVIGARGPTFTRGIRYRLIPASAVRAIGPDAVVVQLGPDTRSESSRLTSLPRLSRVIGRKVVSDQGKYLGSVGDVLIDEEDLRILGYQLNAPGRSGLLEAFFVGKKGRSPDYVRTDTDLRIGEDLIVAPHTAVVHGGTAGAERSAPTPAGAPTRVPTAQPSERAA